MVLNSELSRDVISRLSVKQWCYWLWRLVMSLVRFDASIVRVKQSFIVSQIVSDVQSSSRVLSKGPFIFYGVGGAGGIW